MAQVGTSDLKKGLKVEIDKTPYSVVNYEFFRPGKGNCTVTIRLKDLLSGKEKPITIKTNEKLELADVEEVSFNYSYSGQDSATFMNPNTFDQVEVSFDILGDDKDWLMEEIDYKLVFYKGVPISVTHPTELKMRVTQTIEGAKGNTASGGADKPATLENGVEVMVDSFIKEGDLVAIDMETRKYKGRVTE